MTLLAKFMIKNLWRNIICLLI